MILIEHLGLMIEPPNINVDLKASNLDGILI